MLYFLIPIALIYVATCIVALLLKKSFALMCPLIIMAASLLVYVGGLIHSITLGLVLAGMGVLALAVLLVRKITSSRNEDDTTNLTDIFTHYCLTSGIYFLLICFGCMWLANRHGANLYYFDEFSHWGQMTKELLRLDGYYTSSASTLMRHNEYPPIIPLWEAICCRLSGGFDGRYVYASLWILQLSMLLPFVDFAKDHKKVFTPASLVRLVALLVFSVLFINAFDDETGGFFASLYADVPMAILGGVVLYESFTLVNTPFAWAAFAIELAFLFLIKEASLFFVGLALLVVFLRIVLSKSFRTPQGQIGKSAWFYFVLVVVSCLAVYLSWKIWVYFADFDKSSIQFGSTLSGLLAIAAGNMTDLQRDLMHNYFAALGQTDIYPFLPIRVTYWRGVIAVVGASLLFSVIAKKKPKDIAALLALEIGSSVLYVVFMLMMYFTGFTEWEMSILASFNRYMNTFSSVLFIFAFFYLLSGTFFSGVNQPAAQEALDSAYLASPANQSSAPAKNLRSHLDSAFLVISALGLALILMRSPGALVYKTAEDTSAFTQTQRSKAEFLMDELPEGTNLFYVNQGEAVNDIMTIDYYADGIKFTPGCYKNIDYGNATSRYSEDEWATNVASADYLFIGAENDEFLNTFGKHLSLQTEVGALYKIEGSKDGIVQLSYVTSWSE